MNDQISAGDTFANAYGKRIIAGFFAIILTLALAAETVILGLFGTFIMRH